MPFRSVGDFSIMERVFYGSKLVREGLNGVDEFGNRFGWVMYYVIEFSVEAEAILWNILLKFSLQERPCIGSKQRANALLLPQCLLCGSAVEVALPSTILKRSSDSRMTSTSFCHVDQFGGEQVNFGMP